jgi:hypothetical protein
MIHLDVSGPNASVGSVSLGADIDIRHYRPKAGGPPPHSPAIGGLTN